MLRMLVIVFVSGVYPSILVHLNGVSYHGKSKKYFLGKQRTGVAVLNSTHYCSKTGTE